MAINPQDFEYISKLIRERSAIVLEKGKEYLVDSRLMPIINQEKLGSMEELISKLRNSPPNCLHDKVVDAMTTNETSFFRDVHPFETLKKSIIPEIMAKRSAQKELNIWCGASSSGQEPYTLVMLLLNNFPSLSSWKVTFIATDISDEMLTRCRNGLYSQLEVNRGLPAALMVKYFERKGTEWQIKKELRDMIDFRKMNLATAWPFMPRMDLVMLRNVLIYFDIEVKKTILGKIRQLLKPDGYLFLGGAETTLNLDDKFERMNFVQSGCYRIRQE